MAVSSIQVRIPFTANGVTTNFSFPYKFLVALDLNVYLVDEAGTVLGTPGREFLQVITTNYSVVGVFNPLSGLNDDFSSGASVNFVTAPVTGYTVVIIRNNTDTQDTSLALNSAYSSKVLESTFDKVVMLVQFLLDRSQRSVKMTDANPQTFNPNLPNPIVANSTLATDPTGLFLTMGPTVANITAAAANAAAALASQVAAAASAVASAASATIAGSFFGAQDIARTLFTITNNQVAPSNVTGLLFNNTLVRSAEIDCQFYINTTGAGAVEMSSRAKYLATYKTVGTTWDLSPLGVGGDIEVISGMPSGITLTIASTGQIQYTSTNVLGTPASSKMYFKATTMPV